VTVAVNAKYDLFVPNVFTPNNDNVNDAFKVKVFGNIILFQLRVYNRYGQLVFSTTDPNKGWDGTVNRISADSGTFIYQCAYHIEGRSPAIKKGTVVLIR